jgi:hypothetical protein
MSANRRANDRLTPMSIKRSLRKRPLVYPLEVTMEHYKHRETIALYERLLAETARDQRSGSLRRASEAIGCRISHRQEAASNLVAGGPDGGALRHGSINPDGRRDVFLRDNMAER